MRYSLAMMGLLICGDGVVPFVSAQETDTVPYFGITRTNADSPYHGYARNLSDPQRTLAFCDKVFHWKKSPVVDVNFINCVVPDEAAQVLSGCDFRRLYLSGCKISSAGLQHVLASPHLVSVDVFKAPSVERLDLSVFSAETSRMVGLSIHSSQIDDETLLTFGAIKRPFSLRFSNARITGRGFTGLRGVPNLLDLKLGGNPIDDEGLSKLPQLSKLILLDLSRSKITDGGLAHLSPMPLLTQLDLSGTAITGKELRAFAESQKLFEINLRRTKVTDEWLGKLPLWPKLQHLDLDETLVTDAGLQAFTPPKTLTYFVLGYTKVTPEAMLAFTKLHPHVRIGFQTTETTGMMFYAGVRTNYDAAR